MEREAGENFVDAKQEDSNIYQDILPDNDELINFYTENSQERMAEVYEKVLEVCRVLQNDGGNGLLVGGAVRDMCLGKIPKDFDLEVYGIEPQKVLELAEGIGKVSDVGKAFGILKISFGNGVDIDLSFPRTDSKIGTGHRGFEVKVDPYMSVAEAAKRRDFTINSMAYNPLTRELHDTYGGQEDLKNKVLKVTDEERFQDDALRVMRGMQFVGRFELNVDPKTEEIMRGMVPSMRELPGERLFEEWKKLLLKSRKPSLGIDLGLRLGVIGEIHPELAVLDETDQEPEWHPEGNVWRHTLMSVDEAVKIVRREGLDEHDSLMVMLSALCHDLGKPEVTEFREGRIISHGHEEAGEEPTKAFLKTLRADNLTIKKVVQLVKNHLAPALLYVAETKQGTKISDGAIRRLATRIHPATIEELVIVAEADHMGRGAFRDPEVPEQLLLSDGFPAGDWLLTRARKIAVDKQKPPRIFKGEELFEMGFKAGVNMGRIIDLASDLSAVGGHSKEQIAEMIRGKSEEEAIVLLSGLVEKEE